MFTHALRTIFAYPFHVIVKSKQFIASQTFKMYSDIRALFTKSSMVTISSNIVVKLCLVDLIVANLANHSPLVILSLRSLKNHCCLLLLLTVKMYDAIDITLAHGTLVLRLNPLIDTLKAVNVLTRVEICLRLLRYLL